MKRVTYRTSDEVNAKDADRLGAVTGLTVLPAFPKEGMPGAGETEALVCDLDSVAFGEADWNAEIEQLAELAGRYPVAVHSYQFDEPTAAFLMAAGVIVAERLDGGLFARLAHAIAGVKRRKVA